MEYAIKHIRQEMAKRKIILKMNPAKEIGANLLHEIHSLKLLLDVAEKFTDPRKVTIVE